MKIDSLSPDDSCLNSFSSMLFLNKEEKALKMDQLFDFAMNAFNCRDFLRAIVQFDECLACKNSEISAEARADVYFHLSYSWLALKQITPAIHFARMINTENLKPFLATFHEDYVNTLVSYQNCRERN